MPRLLNVILPYAFAIVGAIAIFFAGSYSSSYFMGRILMPRLGLQDVAELATDHALLTSLDAGKVESARALLIMQEDARLMTVDMMASYYPDDLAKSACRIMQKVAKQRTDNEAKYAATETTSDPEVRNIIAAALQNPSACGRK